MAKMRAAVVEQFGTGLVLREWDTMKAYDTFGDAMKERALKVIIAN